MDKKTKYLNFNNFYYYIFTFIIISDHLYWIINIIINKINV